MLHIDPRDRSILVRVLGQPFDSGEQVANFVGRLPLSDHVRLSVRDTVRGIRPITERDSAIEALVNAASIANELPVVLAGLVEQLPARWDIKQLALTLSRRSWWSSQEPIAVEEVNEKDLQRLSRGEKGLEQLTSECDPFLDAMRVRRCMDESLRRVCFLRRRSDKKQLGTAFLVGRDRLLTCFHVVENDLADRNTQNTTLRLRGIEAVFDFASAVDGTEPNPAQLVGCPVDESDDGPYAPYSQADRHSEDSTLVPQANELDFALLKLVRREEDRRGFFSLADSGVVDLERYSPVIIAQHPGDPPPPMTPTRLLPLKISFAQPGIVGLNPNSTRLLYFSGTLPGSSGSPVFDRSGNVIAMHHNRGDWTDSKRVLTRNNRGVPIRAIAQALKARGIALDKNPEPHLSADNDRKVDREGGASSEWENSLLAMTTDELKGLLTSQLWERPDDIEAWAREPVSGQVLLRWAASHRRTKDLRAAIEAKPKRTS